MNLLGHIVVEVAGMVFLAWVLGMLAIAVILAGADLVKALIGGRRQDQR